MRGVSSLLGAVNTPPEAYGERIGLAEALARRSLGGVGSTRLAPTLFAAGEAFLTWGRRTEAEQLWNRTTEVAAQSRDAGVALWPLTVEAVLAILDGRLERVIGLGDQMRARGAELGQEHAAHQHASRSTRRALLYLGGVADALSALPEARGDIFAQGGTFWAQRAQFLAHAGRREEASGIHERFLAGRDLGRTDDPTSVNVLRYLLDAAVALGHADVARVLQGRMGPLAGLLDTQVQMIYNIGRLCGGAAVLMGEPERARQYYAQGLDVCLRVRFRPEIALTRLEIAELLLHHYPDERPAALQHLDFAIAEFRETKMQPSLERALKHKGLLRA